jgi:hypothetical protein
MASHVRHQPDSEGWSKWVQPVEQGYRMSCCDCGLVHEMDFRVEDGRAQFRARRHERSTAAVRRERRKREAE